MHNAADMKLKAPIQTPLDMLLVSDKTNMVELPSSGFTGPPQLGQQALPDHPLSSPDAW